jgi:mRNA interferase HigB
VRAISRRRLEKFWRKHTRAKDKLLAWYKVVKKAEWRSFLDVRQAYPRVDRVGECYVFDFSAGAAYRLIAKISHDWTVLLICLVLDHKEYDRDDWKKTCRCYA